MLQTIEVCTSVRRMAGETGIPKSNLIGFDLTDNLADNQSG